MLDKQQKQPGLQFLDCPSCQRHGVLNGKECAHCQGVGVVAWTGSHLLYWGKIIDAPHLYQEKIKNLINQAINIILLVFGALGLILAAWQIWESARADPTFWKFWEIQSGKMLIFWLSLLTDGYLFYRYQQELAAIKQIPTHFPGVSKAASSQAVSQKIDWSIIKTLAPAQKIDAAELFSPAALSAVYKTWQLAKKYGHHQIAPVHLLIALLTFPEIANMLVRMNVSFAALKNKISRLLSPYLIPTGQELQFTPDLKKVLLQSFFEAGQLQQKKVELTELLIGTVKISKPVSDLLYDLEVDLDKIKNVALWLRVTKTLQANYQKFRYRASFRPKSSINRTMTATATPFLDSFGQDLTMLAKFGYLAPCVGREKEIEEIFRAIAGGNRVSVILVGNPGVGKRTIINGIAQMMVAEEVPALLSDKRLVSLSVAKLISGVSPSEAQQRLLIVINEVLRSGNIVLFIHDIAGMAGITSGGPGSIDLADVLAQELTKGNLIALATAVPQDYTRYLEGKSALAEVLEKIAVEEPTGNSAIQILEAKAGPIEYKYNIYFSYDAIAKAVELSDRYLHDRFLPEKAIEILEETAVRVGRQKGKEGTVSGNDVAITVSEKTEIPLAEITKAESKKLLRLEEEIHKRMINQEEAVTMVSAALRRARAELRETKRPIANFLFLGPTGVGKTELAKTVAEVYFGSEGKMIRLDMSEYQDKFSVHRLIGAPGSGEGGYLTENVRQHPFSLLLLDEMEKAHPDILNLFLQVMDDGRLTDATGRTVDFTNVILIGTSNACSLSIKEMVGQGINVEEIKKRLLEKEIFEYFRPEFLNRMDGVIIFKPLSKENVFAIAKLMLNKVAASLEVRGISLKAEEAAVHELVKAGFDPEYGARPLRRVIQEKVSNVLANYILSGQLKRRDAVVLKGGGELEIVKPPD